MYATFRSVMLWMGLLVVIFLAWHFAQIQKKETAIRFSDFMAQVEDGQVAEVVIAGDELRGHFKDRESFRTRVPRGYVAYVNLLREHDVAFHVERDETPTWANMVISWAPFILLIGFWVFFLRQFRGKGVTNIEKAKLAELTRLDLSGAPITASAGPALDDFVALLKSDPAPTVLLTGPSGSGKSHLLRAASYRLDRPVLLADTAQLTEVFVGIAASRIRDMFARARTERAAVIALDGLDLLRRRGGDERSEADERVQALQQLASALDARRGDPIFAFVALTNRPDLVDEALLRRFDRVITIEAPDRGQRAHMLGQLAKGIALSPEADVDALAGRTDGFLPADLAAVLDEARRHAGGRAIGNADLEAGLAARAAVRRTLPTVA